MKEQKGSSKNRKWTFIKRLGITGFLFFLFKGIGWLLFFYFGATLFKGCGI